MQLENISLGISILFIVIIIIYIINSNKLSNKSNINKTVFTKSYYDVPLSSNWTWDEFYKDINISRRTKPCTNANPSDFDLWKLDYSYAPSFCEQHGWPDVEECQKDSNGIPKYGWILHGLWPQNCTSSTKCPWPENCKYPTVYTDQQLLSFLDQADPNWMDIVPEYKDQDSTGTLMVRHEWLRHGTCSGLNPVEYFKLGIQKARTYLPKNNNQSDASICFDKTFDNIIDCNISC